MMDAPAYPALAILPGHERRLRLGHPWVYSNEVRMDPAAKSLPAGELVRLTEAGGRPVAVATFNPHSLIAARVLSREADATIDAGFLAERLRQALTLRERLFDEPFYRLVHAEADGLPGLAIDRYGDVAAVQINTAGMERLRPALLEALEEVLRPAVVVLRGDSPVRELEGLERTVEIPKGRIDGPIEVRENGVRFLVDLIGGQKTGWYYDQRENRAFVARLAEGRRVADFYSYAGGFGVSALTRGAVEALCVDRSEAALALAVEAAERNGFADRCRVERAEVFAAMARLAREGERFGVVVADPPAFVKSRKELGSGARGYRKMTRLAAALVGPGGLLAVGCCSHHVDAALFADMVRRGLNDAGRQGRILRASGAGPDHPVHPSLPESAYLKFLAIHLD